MNFEEYRAIDAINWSSLKEMRVSAKHYRASLSKERSDTVAMRLGRALHTYVLEPELFPVKHLVFDGPVRRGKAWDTFKEVHKDADILNNAEMDKVLAMGQAVLTSEYAIEHLRDGITEKTLRWVDGPTGLACKGRCDSVNGHLVELKTCNAQSFPPERFITHAARLEYHGQVAFYADGLVAQGYEVDKRPAMIVVESEPPFDVAVYVVKPEFMECGRNLYRTYLDKVKACKDSGQWPGIDSKGLHLGLPAWAELEAL